LLTPPQILANAPQAGALLLNGCRLGEACGGMTALAPLARRCAMLRSAWRDSHAQPEPFLTREARGLPRGAASGPGRALHRQRSRFALPEQLLTLS
jgi:hypothetical protein